ncbi:MAG TPA: caspase family protein, partial [Candidatus Lambdaproteobacteria bacterium]|nr:caspase family protein [Candidatus Lambdaproteobacteria bacterium]
MRNHLKQQNKERSMKKTLFFLFSLMLCWSTAFAAERAIKRQTLSSPSPVETPYLSGKYRALVIGNNDYDDPEKLWPSLKTAVADAEAVADILKTDYGFAEIILLKNATRRDIVKAFNRLAKEAQTNDSVLIYYAGHGYLNEDTKEGFWIPVDAEGRDDSTFVRNSTIKVKLGVIADKARHVLLVSDSCFSGALLREGNRGVSLDQKNERYYQKVAKKKSVQILAAGGLEFVDDNYKGAGHSPFTYYLLQSLKDNNARYFEATDLSQETSRNVSVNTMQTPESGVLQGAGHAGGEFFFLRK